MCSSVVQPDTDFLRVALFDMTESVNNVRSLFAKIPSLLRFL